MKNKLLKVISIFITFMLAAFTLSACSAHGAPKHDVSTPSYVISAETMQAKTEEFITACKDRTSTTDAEKAAAQYLKSTLEGYGYDNVDEQPFQYSEKEKTYYSQNVVAFYESAAENPKNVIIGAYYDNRMSAFGNYAAIGAEGALSNGTGVAALLALAEYLQENKPQYDFDVSIVFFGASMTSTVGAQAFYNNMTIPERANTVLMVELQRLGADNVYAFSDARATQRQTLFNSVASENGLDIYNITQKTPLMTGFYSINGVPYYQWAHMGVYPVFLNSGIPTLNLISANWETMNLTDTESANNPNISLTSADTLANLKSSYSDYGEKMATAVSLVLKSFDNADFLSVMQSDKTNFPNTDVLTSAWIWQLVVIGIIILAAVALYLINFRLIKKYKTEASRPPQKVKMAVFGMDYEDKKPDEVYIDFKLKQQDEIFPGVPNNDSVINTQPIDNVFGLPIAPIAAESHSNEPKEKEDSTVNERATNTLEPNAVDELDTGSLAGVSETDSVRIDTENSGDIADKNDIATQSKAVEHESQTLTEQAKAVEHESQTLTEQATKAPSSRKSGSNEVNKAPKNTQATTTRKSAATSNRTTRPTSTKKPIKSQKVSPQGESQTHNDADKGEDNK